jgi:hypothetical protein
MLRRHLKRGGAPVAACAGFDPDAASAYLEDGLGKSTRARYESHLAGCASCRRHLIELARLSQLAPQAETQPVAAPGHPTWVRWKETVAGWLDFSTWNWKWQTAGVAGAAFAILIAALGGQVWRQMSKPASDQVAARSSAEASPTAGSVSPSPEPSPQITEDSNLSNFSAPSQPNERVPKPDVDPKRDENEIAVVPSDRSLNLPAGQADSQLELPGRRSFALPAAQQLRTAALQSLVAPAPQTVQVGAEERAADQVAAPLADKAQEEALEVSGRQDMTARITPPPEYNPMNSVSQKPSSARDRAQNEKAASQSPKPGWVDRVMGFMPARKSEPERKPSLGNQDDESFKPMTVRIRDKVFRFERNIWIDQAYKPAMQWRVLKLTRGSKDYERVLANDPQLKEFFDHGPILIVWKDKIYKVVQ